MASVDDLLLLRDFPCVSDTSVSSAGASPTVTRLTEEHPEPAETSKLASSDELQDSSPLASSPLSLPSIQSLVGTSDQSKLDGLSFAEDPRVSAWVLTGTIEPRGEAPRRWSDLERTDKMPEEGAGGDVPSSAKTSTSKASIYKSAICEALFEQVGVFLNEDDQGISKPLYLIKDECYTPDTRKWSDDHWAASMDNAKQGNEVDLVMFLGELYVPNPITVGLDLKLDIGKTLQLRCDQMWTRTTSIIRGGHVSKPDFAVCFTMSAFSAEQHELGLQKYLVEDGRYFPILIAEAKNQQTIDFAHRQNAQHTAIAIRMIVDLAKETNSLPKLQRKPLVFSISFNADRAIIYTHYPVIQADGTVHIHRSPLHDIAVDVRPQTRYDVFRFTVNLYRTWAPSHLAMLHELLDLRVSPMHQ